MNSLFDKTKIKSMELKNRLVRSATFERMCGKDGYPIEELRYLYEKLAKGGIGMIITGFATVSPDDRIPYAARIDDDLLIPEFRTITEIVHKYDCKITMQINHCGRQAVTTAGKTPIAPSPVKTKNVSAVEPREMTEQDIERVINDYVKAASRVKNAGFDAVQIHAAHGYLVNQFLSPYTNQRKDRWGGSLENRMRFLKEIYTRCRRELGENFPILIKLNAYDNMKKGLKLNEGIKIAGMVSEIGFDGIEVSCGIPDDGMSTLRGNFPVDILIDDFKIFDKKPVLRFLMRHFGKSILKVPAFTIGYNRDAARLIKEKVKVPVFTVGGMHNPKVMIDTIQKGDADYISLCRPLIMDPAFPSKIKEGNLSLSKCLQCNHCIIYTSAIAPLKCYYGKRINNAN